MLLLYDLYLIAVTPLVDEVVPIEFVVVVVLVI